MPCESCNTQFTVFRRKKACTECRRLYCSQCLVKRYERLLCERCVILTKRPLSKFDLLKLKPKDLIYFLQSKHVSTHGCIEKEELVTLVMNWVALNDDGPDQPSPSGSAGSSANAFDQLRQSCQNMFTTFADKIASDLNLDAKTNLTHSPGRSTTSANITTTQPQATAAQFSTSFVTSGRHGPSTTATTTTPPQSHTTTSTPHASTSNARQFTTTSTSIASGSAHVPSSNAAGSSTNTPGNRHEHPSQNHSSCDCVCDHAADGEDDANADAMDDELINSFRRSQSHHSELAAVQLPVTTSSTSTTSCEQPPPVSNDSNSLQANAQLRSSAIDSDNTSSFEELATVSQDTPAAAVQATTGEFDNWTIVDHADDAGEATTPNILVSEPQPLLRNSDELIQPAAAANPRRVHRRRSESALLAGRSPRPHFSIDADIDDDDDMGINDHNDETNQHHSQSTTGPQMPATTSACGRCGKRKENIRRHVSRFKRQLESRQVDESEMRAELAAFLTFLEQQSQRNASVDEGSNHDVADDEGAGPAVADVANDIPAPVASESVTMADEQDFSFDGYDDGIHVYASDDPNGGRQPAQGFFNLTDVQHSSELEDLTVKQLKEILVLNRVDYKGCCEKNELLERVKRLWNDCKTCPDVDRLPSDDVCKICMDAPIECVILECGHMATCTSCGKVLSECPICRQYIVRVVRFFRA